MVIHSMEKNKAGLRNKGMLGWKCEVRESFSKVTFMCLKWVPLALFGEQQGCQCFGAEWEVEVGQRREESTGRGWLAGPS